MSTRLHCLKPLQGEPIRRHRRPIPRSSPNPSLDLFCSAKHCFASLKMSIKVRCHECKEELSGLETGRQHEKATGHSWQPGYSCTVCLATFSSYTGGKTHTNTPGVHSGIATVESSTSSLPSTRFASAAAPTPGTGSSKISEVVSCSWCWEQFGSSQALAMHQRSTHPPTAGHVAVVKEKFACGICQVSFSSAVKLDKHLDDAFTCKLCNVHLGSSRGLQEHYRESSMHATCKTCGIGFDSLYEWSTHRNDCQGSRQAPMDDIPVTPVSSASDDLANPASARHETGSLDGPAKASSFQPTSDVSGRYSPPPAVAVATPQDCIDAASISDLPDSSTAPTSSKFGISSRDFSPAFSGSDTSAYTTPASTPVKLHEREVQARALDRVRTHTGASPDALGFQTLHANVAHAERLYRVLEGDSVAAYPDAHIPASPHERVLAPPDSDRVLRDGARSRREAPGAISSHLDGCRANSGVPLRTHPRRGPTVHPETGTSSDAPPRASFHCRLCFQDPCFEPVTTVCGHLFCRGCIIQELATNMRCPVCERTFLVTLNLST
ncbi:hypothetical protein C8Q80DRAFT_753419 [Daedaleopsis nitida]|nr:hypothetical protein C8Q80DRAFT_753419 [Daedaleopsis nitida]